MPNATFYLSDGLPFTQERQSIALRLPNGRRADITALSADGLVWIVEIKSSVSDLRSDHNWGDDGPYCDHFLCAVASGFNLGLLPPDAGVIVPRPFDQ
jgi:hypothetical protein